jgi:hypothetical protein
MLFSTEPTQQPTEESSPGTASKKGEVEAEAEVIYTPPSVVPATTKAAEDNNNPYPIDLPSPLLLASSMVLAIAGTGEMICAQR